MSLANLNTEEYAAIGRDLLDVAQRAVELWKQSGGDGKGKRRGT